MGTARMRVMQDMVVQRNKVLLQRQEAAARKAKASRYSRLVNELVPGGKGGQNAQMTDPAGYARNKPPHLPATRLPAQLLPPPSRSSDAPPFERTDSSAIHSTITRNGLAPASLAAGGRGANSYRSPAKVRGDSCREATKKCPRSDREATEKRSRSDPEVSQKRLRSVREATEKQSDPEVTQK